MDLGNDDFIRQSKSDHINDILVRHAVRHLLGPYHRGQQNEQQGGELFQRDLLGGEWIVQECVENYSFDARNRARTIAGGPRSNRVVSDVSLNKGGYAGPRGFDVGGVLAKRMSVVPQEKWSSKRRRESRELLRQLASPSLKKIAGHLLNVAARYRGGRCPSKRREGKRQCIPRPRLQGSNIAPTRRHARSRLARRVLRRCRLDA